MNYKLKVPSIILCLVMLMPVMGWGAMYYLDQSATGAGTGESWENAFSSLSQAQAAVQSGDTVTVRNGSYGDYYEDERSNGTDRTDWVTYKAADGHNPEFALINVNNQGRVYDTYLRFDGFTIRPDFDDRYVLTVRYSRYTEFLNLNVIGRGAKHTVHGFRGWGNSSDITIDNCTFSGGDRQGRYDGFINAMYFREVSNVTITNNEMRQFHRYGIMISNNNVVIRNNNIHVIGGDGIFFGGGPGPLLIENNEIHDLQVYYPVLQETPAETTWSDDGTTMYNPSANWGADSEPVAWPVIVEIVIRSGNNVIKESWADGFGDDQVRVDEVISPTEIRFDKSIKADPDGPAPSNVDYILRDQVHGDLIQHGAGGNSYNVTIRGNELYDVLGGWAFMHLQPWNYDNPDRGIGGHNFVIENNLCWNSYSDGHEEYGHPLNVRHTDGMIFRNNIIIGRVQVGSDRNVVFSNNIVGYIQIQSDAGLIESDYNIYNRGQVNEAFPAGGNTTFINPGYNWDEWNNNAFTSIFADYNNGDFQHASASSLGVGHSNPSNSPPMDILGYERDSSPDAGCYEYGADTLWIEQDDNPTPDPELEEDAVNDIPDQTFLRISNNIIKSGGNSEVTINCDVKDAGNLSVKIYDSKGKEIITLWNKHEEPGTVPITWTGMDSGGSKVGSGIYLVHMECGVYKETKKIAIVR